MTESIPGPTPGPRGRLPFAGIVAGFLVVPVAFLCWSYLRFGSPKTALAYLSGARVLVSPGSAVFEGRDGETRRLTFSVQNLTEKPIHVLGSNATCSCVTATGLPFEVPGGGARDLVVTYRLDAKIAGVGQQLSLVTDCPEAPGIKLRVSGRLAGAD